MAKQEHFEILKQGIETWNLWLEEHAVIRPDLNFANLSYANLSGADLNKALQLHLKAGQ